MHGFPTGLWGKFQKDLLEYHPLPHHCADVGTCLEVLLALPVLRQKLARTGGREDLSMVQVQRLAFLAALHDLGKLNHGFQRQIQENQLRGGHVSPALVLLTDGKLREKALQALDFEALGAWCTKPTAVLQLLWAAISHHGRPAAPLEGIHPRIWEPDGGVDPLSGLKQLVTSAKNWFPAAFEFQNESSQLPSLPQFQHAFSGLVMLADWIGSDTRLFPYSKSEDDDRMAFAREQARKALKELGMDPAGARQSVATGLPTFQETYGFTPRPVQEAIEHLSLPGSGSVVVLEAETGSGKTEAAFRYYLRVFHAGLVDGMYFALPTRSAATQIHGRITGWTKKTFGEHAPPVVLAVPGYIKVDEQTGVQLAPFEVLWPDEDRFRFRGWAAEHPKRYMAAPIIVGTVDQVLLSTLQVSHAHMRASALLRHLLVVDEVHASDAYMTALLEEVLKHHVRAGGHALLMSATLGARARTRFLALGRAEHLTSNSPVHTGIDPFKDAVQAPYPAIMLRFPRIRGDRPGIEPPQVITAPPQERGKMVKIDLHPVAHDPVAIADLALEKARLGARVLVLRNLVDDAIRTQRALEDLAGDDPVLFRCRGVITLHHGRFAPEDRKALDQALEERFGKESRSGAGVVVTTQTVEQSLDIDFDLILSDLCPMDVLLQRLGRLHRHQRCRPTGFEMPRAIVLTPPERDLGRFIIEKGERRGLARDSHAHGLGTVYEDVRIIEATWRLLEKHPIIEIPAMNRYLVESATHPERLDEIVNELGDVWHEHSNRMEGIRISHSGLARTNAIRRDAPFGTIDCLFGSIDEKIRTRLGEDDRLVRFSTPIRSPFGHLLSTLTIRGWMAKAAGSDAEASEVSESEGRVVFRFGEATYEYDRLGLRKVGPPAQWGETPLRRVHVQSAE